MLKTAFWRKAARSLPKSVQARYVGHFEDAERFELALDRLIGGCNALARFLRLPHGHAH